MRKIIQLMLGAFLFLLPACSDNDGADNVDTKTERRLELNATQMAVGDKTAAFADALMDEANRQLANKDEFVISPLSAEMVLSLVANGCSGETLDEILKCLNITSGDLASLNELNLTLLKQLPDFSANKMVIGNGLFCDNILLSSQMKDAYAQALAKYYSAEVFTGPQASLAAKVNSWVSRINGSKMPLLDGTEEGPLFIVNAFRFEALWKDEPEPCTMNFHNANGTQINKKGLKLLAHSYRKNEDGEAADVDYANSAFFLRVYVPAEGVSVEKAVASLRQAECADYRTIHGNVEVEFPEFELAQQADITPILEGCGINCLFQKGLCDMTGMFENTELYLVKVKQNNEVRFDKKGVAVQTSTEGEAHYGLPFVAVSVKADRPFAFEIRATDTEVVILQGRVNNLN